MPGKHTRTTTQRGLGYRHKQQVLALKKRHREGSPCWWCGEPMYLSQGLSGDHSVPRSQGGVNADRLLHAQCNTDRGDGHRDHLRPAVTGSASGTKLTQHAPELGRRIMRWP